MYSQQLTLCYCLVKSLLLHIVKFRKQAQGLIFFKGPFWGAYFWRAYLRREICVSKSIGLALQLEVNFRFCFVLLCIRGQFSRYKAPEGLYSEGWFNGGFFLLPGWGAYIWRGLWTERLIFGILRYSLLKFVYVIDQSCHPLVVHPLLRKILDPPLVYAFLLKCDQFRNSPTTQAKENINLV